MERVELRRGDGEVRVFLEHDEQVSWRCAECDAECGLHDHQSERRRRHLDTCQYRTILHARPPRSDCAEHGPRVVRLPWAGPSSRFTALFEALAISGLKEASRTGVAEKSFRKRHRYVTVVNDLNRSRILYVAVGRRKASLDGFWKTLSKEQLAAVETVAMDMWDPFVASTREHLPESEKKIVYGNYHIAAYLSKAVDQVRRAENKFLRASGDDRLSGTKYSWLRHPANFSKDALRESELKTARAWALKETAMRLFDYRRESATRTFFELWRGWASRSRRTPMGRCGADVDDSPRQHTHLSETPHYQRCQRRLEFKDSMGQGHRTRLPQSTELHPRHLLPLRRPRYGPRPLRIRKATCSSTRPAFSHYSRSPAADPAPPVPSRTRIALGAAPRTQARFGHD